MKVRNISKEDKVALANIVDMFAEWKAIKALAVIRQDELKTLVAADTTCTLEELRLNQGKLLEVRWLIDQLSAIHTEVNKT